MRRYLLQTISDAIRQSDLGGGEAAEGLAVSFAGEFGGYVIQKQREVTYARIVQSCHLC